MYFGDGTSADIRAGQPLALGERYILFYQDERDTPYGMPAALAETSTATARRATDGGSAI
jgi:hypothetical protein